MATETLTSRQYVGKLQLFYIALLASQLMLMAVFVALYFAGMIEPSDDTLGKVFLFLVPALALLGIILDRLVSIPKMFKLKSNHTLNYKLIKYQGGFLLKLFFLELPSILASVAFYLSSNFIFIGVAAILAFVFIFKRPTPVSIIKELELDEEDQSLMNNPDAIVGEFEISTSD